MRSLITVSFLILLQTNLFSQTSSSDPVDVQGWYGTGVNWPLKKKWEVGLDYQVRYQNNLKSYKGTYISLSGSKSISDKIDLLAEYRFARVGAANYHRYTAGAEYGRKIHAAKISFRLLVLNNIQDFLDPAEASEKAMYWRTRLKLAYKFNENWEGYLSTEPVMKWGADYFIDNWRNTAGIKRKITPGMKLDLYYIYRPDYAKATYNRVFHIIGLNADFKIISKQKKAGKRSGKKI